LNPPSQEFEVIMSTQSSEWITKLWDRYQDGFTLIWLEFPSTTVSERFTRSLTEVKPTFAEMTGFVNPSGKVTVGIAGELPRSAIREVIAKGREFGDEPLTQAFGPTAIATLGPILAEMGMKGYSVDSPKIALPAKRNKSGGGRNSPIRDRAPDSDRVRKGQVRSPMLWPWFAGSGIIVAVAGVICICLVYGQRKSEKDKSVVSTIAEQPKATKGEVVATTPANTSKGKEQQPLTNENSLAESVKPKEMVKAKTTNLKGEWQIVRSEHLGRPRAQLANNSQMVFTESQVSINAGQGGFTRSYRLDESKSPATIDLTADDGTWPGIYRLDGDTLTICLRITAGLRPRVFNSSADDQDLMLFICRRSEPVMTQPRFDEPIDLASLEPRIANSLKMDLVLVKPGSFIMGKDADGFTEKPSHKVTLSRPIFVGAHEVTRGQFRLFVNDTTYHGGAKFQTESQRNGKGCYGYYKETGEFTDRQPRFFWDNTGFEQTDSHPVVNVSWSDVMAFCRWLSKKEGKYYDLPTEAEWEYLCRAGTTTRFSTGTEERSLEKYCNYKDLAFDLYCPPKSASYQKERWNDGFAFTAPIGSFRANPLGLYDLHGNVAEWCADRPRKYVAQNETDPVGDDHNSTEFGVNRRVTRGGSWHSDFLHEFVTTYRGLSWEPGESNYYLGFRVVQRPGAKLP